MIRTPDLHEIPAYNRLPVEIVSGSGVGLTDADGREYRDFYGGHAVAQLGYGHPRVVAALARQAETLIFQSNLVDLDVRRRAQARLANFAPAGLDRVFLVNSGAEANENALRLAFLATRREHVVALRGGFHGRTAAAAAVTDGADRWYAFPQRPFEVSFVEPGDEAALEAAVTSRTAAIILEPVQGMAGAVPLAEDFLRAVRAVADEHGTLVIADEVQCGMGRTGTPFAIEASGVGVDILTTAKGLAAGYPAGAVVTSEQLSGKVQPGDLGTTFGGGPLAAALIEVVVDELEGPGFLERVGRLEASIRERCVVGPVQSIQGRGLLLGLRTEGAASLVVAGLRERGILTGGARDPHIVRLLPPLTLEESDVDALAQALGELS